MKILKVLSVLMVLSLFSCASDDVQIESDTSVSFSEETKVLPIYKLAIQMQELAQQNELSAANDLRLKRIATTILEDVKIIEAIYKNEEVTKAGNAVCTAGSICSNQYASCTAWATSWNNLLASCNGPVNNRPNNCDQIRADYINNLDKIEATYQKCQLELGYCLKVYCPGDDGGFGEPL